MLKLISMATVVGLCAIGCGGAKPASSPTTGPTGGGTEAAVNGCETYKDLTAVGAYEIKWDESIASSEDRCIKLSVDQPMSWVGNFTTHPIKAAGGATPNPFDAMKGDNLSNPGTEQESGAVSFKTPGTYGYVCGVHSTMTGAVLVVPAVAP
jgi:hypothetical protein